MSGAFTKRHREILAPLTEAIHSFTDHVLALDDAALKEVLKACESPTNTNCGWAEYWAAKPAKEIVLTEINMRARRKSRALP